MAYEDRRDQHSVMNTWGIGGDDVMMTTRHYDGKITYLDMSYQQAFKLSKELERAAREAQEIEESYIDSGFGDWLLDQILQYYGYNTKY